MSYAYLKIQSATTVMLFGDLYEETPTLHWAVNIEKNMILKDVILKKYSKKYIILKKTKNKTNHIEKISKKTIITDIK